MTISAALKDHYERGYADYSRAEWRALGALHKAANIMHLCESLPHERILEIGGGDGAILECLRKNSFGREWHAVEISNSAVLLMNSKGFPSQLFDGGTLPHANKSFDLVILSHVVEHLEHPRMLLQEAARVGAHVCVEVPLEHTIRMKDEDVFRSVGHLNYFTPSTARMLMMSAGYDIVSTRLDNPSRTNLIFNHGPWKGTLIWSIRELGLKLVPGLATKIFQYHYALLGRPRATGITLNPGT
jgi:ubiquinone/menaquinone biosynthesis C-methylase UbiE